MAGIDKICEFSGDYEPMEMYEAKRNHIQVLSKYRKEFRGAEATLYIFEGDLHEVSPGGSYWKAELDAIVSQPTEADWDSGNGYRYGLYEYGRRNIYQVFFDNLAGYKKFAKKQRNLRVIPEYTYVLSVPSVPGKVGGIYINNTFAISDVKRRMKRLIGKKLKIKKVQGDAYDYARNYLQHVMVTE